MIWYVVTGLQLLYLFLPSIEPFTKDCVDWRVCVCVCACVGHICPNRGGSEEWSDTGDVPWGARKRQHQGICEPSCQCLNDINSNNDNYLIFL